MSFLFITPTTPHIYTLSLHDALPISFRLKGRYGIARSSPAATGNPDARESSMSSPRSYAAAWQSAKRSEEHTSELQSRRDLVCRLLLEKKKNKIYLIIYSVLLLYTNT